MANNVIKAPGRLPQRKTIEYEYEYRFTEYEYESCPSPPAPLPRSTGARGERGSLVRPARPMFDGPRPSGVARGQGRASGWRGRASDRQVVVGGHWQRDRDEDRDRIGRGDT